MSKEDIEASYKIDTSSVYILVAIVTLLFLDRFCDRYWDDSRYWWALFVLLILVRLFYFGWGVGLLMLGSFNFYLFYFFNRGGDALLTRGMSNGFSSYKKDGF